MRSILYYITGHGYGHAVRSAQVIRALQELDTQLEVYVRTTAPQWLFDGLPRPVAYDSRRLDVGVLQPDSLRMDLAATLAACRDLRERMPRILDEEVAFVRAQGIDMIAGDIPPACFEVARWANVPSAAITNFTWDVIYRAYSHEYPDFMPLIEEISSFYRSADVALALPYPCDLSMFRAVEPIPWITRQSDMTRAQARDRFALPQSATIVLLSFGGIGLDPFPLERLQAMREFYFVATGSGESRGNVRVLGSAQRCYENLVRAADVIVTKPGYGIVADALSHQIPVLYTDRGDFPEYPQLVRALTHLATAEFIPQEALRSGELGPYIRCLLGKKPNWPGVRLDGAWAAAKHLLKLRR